MAIYRCAYCNGDLGAAPAARCPHCGKAMLLPKDNAKPTSKRKRRQRDRADPPAGPVVFRPGKNPAILGGAILLFIILGTLLTTQLETPQSQPTLQVDPIARALREVDVLLTALEHFHNDTGRYPTAAEGLVALVQDPGIPGWAGHYVNLIHPDPWNTPYRYTPPPDGPEVRSAGPDRTFNTEQDIYTTVNANNAP